MPPRKKRVAKKKYTPLKKNRKNTSGRPSKAKRQGMKKVNSGKKKVATKKKRSYALRIPKPQTAKQLPETDQTKKGLPLRKLLRGTPRLMINNAKDVDIIKFKKAKTRSGMPAISAVCVSHDMHRPNKVIRKHKVYIIGAEKDKEGNIPKKTVNRHRKVLVSCDCENFMFTWEYANATYGASRIIYCNGEPPVVTNPALAFGMCKHLVAVASEIIRKDK